MAKTAVAVKKEGAVSDVLPEFMQEHVGLGTEALGAGDVEIPRIRLMQMISPEIAEIDGLKAGDFYHAMIEENLGKEVRICPIFIDNRFILWRPRETGGGILARADDGRHWSPANTEFTVKLKSGVEVKWRTTETVESSGLADWGSSNPSDPNSPPAATRMYNMVVTFPDDPDMPPAVVTLQRAAIKVARRFIGKLKITRAPSFGLIFKMKSTKEKGPSGDFFNYQFVSDGQVEDKGFYTKNFEAYKYFKAQGLQVKDIETAQDDALADVETTPEGSPKI